MRFPRIYERNISSYSKEIRAEIAEVYGKKLCSETIRPLLKKLKLHFREAAAAKSCKRETDCEYTLAEEKLNDAETVILPSVIAKDNTEEPSCNRNESPVSELSPNNSVYFINHLGVLIFSSILQKVEALSGWLTKQWLAALFLGAVNIEQSKLLDFESLETVLGKTLFSRGFFPVPRQPSAP